MIGFIQGQLYEIFEESVIVLVAGVGYEIQLPMRILQENDLKLGQEVNFAIYTHVREDALQLFGFNSFVEKDFFLTLLKINGIGPKLALNIIGGATLEQIHSLVEAEDVKGLSQLPKVGKKTAEQMILALKGKLKLATPKHKPENDNAKAIQSALVNLGYKEQDVVHALQKIPRDMNVQDAIRAGLQELSSSNY